MRLSHRRRSVDPRLLLALVALAGILAPLTLEAQDTLQAGDTIAVADTLPPPPDTWESDEVRALLERAVAARGDLAEGLASYEGVMWERIYLGLSAGIWRRERSLFERERRARVRWSSEGDHIVRWDAARRDVPIMGMTSSGDLDQAEDLAEELAEDAVPPPLAYDPGSDRIFFGGGGGWGLDPLADTAAHHYRYHAGDTLRITLPEGQQVVLAEVRASPRRADSRLLAASLWFDEATGRLVRAGYRPARPFDLELDEPDDAEDVPGILLPIRAEIRYVTVDHALYDFRWWLPRSFGFEGEATVGRLGRFPVRFEWTLEGLTVNEAPSPALDPEAELPPGWTRHAAGEEGPDGEPREVTVVVPPADSLAALPPLSAGPSGGVTGGFRPGELEELEDDLRELLPGPAGVPVRYSAGLQDGMTRYNRVEGLSTGVAAELDVKGELRARGEIRLGVADLEPGVELGLRRRRGDVTESLALYRRLTPSADWGRPLSLGASVGTLMFGSERDPFHRSGGVELMRTADGAGLRTRLRAFAEMQWSAARRTHAHLGRLLYDDELAPNPPADRARLGGLGIGASWQSGLSSARTQLLAEAHLEGAGGTWGPSGEEERGVYGRGWGSAGLRVPFLPGWSGALEVGGGSGLGELPRQRRFFPGGARVFRGARVGEAVADAFWFGRAEVGRGPAGARISGFVDVLGAAPPGEGFAGDPDVAVGVGASLMDGLLRLDLVRTLGDEGRFRLVGYLDGLL